MFYNLFVALLKCWRMEDDNPVGTLIVKVPKYPFIDTRIAPGPSESVRLTPTLAGALVLRVLQKFTTAQPAYWTAVALTRGLQPSLVGTVQTMLLAPFSSFSATELLSNTASMTHAESESLLTKSSQILNISAGYHMGYSIQITGPMPVVHHSSAREAWLEYFLSWSSELVIIEIIINIYKILINVYIRPSCQSTGPG